MEGGRGEGESEGGRQRWKEGERDKRLYIYTFLETSKVLLQFAPDHLGSLSMKPSPSSPDTQTSPSCQQSLSPRERREEGGWQGVGCVLPV